MRYLLIALLFCYTSVKSQSVNDVEVLPTSVNVNNILKLNITSGNDISFNFTDVALLKSGIENTESYTTKFEVSASNSYMVTMTSEEKLKGDNNELELNVLGYEIDSSFFILQKSNILVSGVPTVLNKYEIKWECGTKRTESVFGIKPDSYTTDINLIIEIE